MIHYCLTLHFYFQVQNKYDIKKNKPKATTMLVERYRPILYLQYLLLSVDLFMNSFIELLRFENVILLVLLV